MVSEPIPTECLDIPVGLMIETPYGWKEYCEEHGRGYLAVYPDRRSRIADLYEVRVSHRQYRCQSCNRPLWEPISKGEKDDVDV